MRRRVSVYGNRPAKTTDPIEPERLDEATRGLLLAASADDLDVGVYAALRPAPRGTAAAASRDSCGRARRNAVCRAPASDGPAARAASSTSSSMPFHTSIAGEPAAATTPCSLQAASEVRRRRGDGARQPGEAPQVRPAVTTRRLRGAAGAAQRTPLPGVQHPQHEPRERRGRLDADVDAVVHRVHDRQPVARGEPMPGEGAPEVGLHVHDIDRWARRERGIDEPIGAAARPRQRVLAVGGDRDRGRVHVAGIRSRGGARARASSAPRSSRCGRRARGTVRCRRIDT